MTAMAMFVPLAAARSDAQASRWMAGHSVAKVESLDYVPAAEPVLAAVPLDVRAAQE